MRVYVYWLLQRTRNTETEASLRIAKEKITKLRTKLKTEFDKVNKHCYVKGKENTGKGREREGRGGEEREREEGEEREREGERGRGGEGECVCQIYLGMYMN